MSTTPILALTNDEALLDSLRSTVRDQFGEKRFQIIHGTVGGRSMLAFEDSTSPAHCRVHLGRRQRAIRTARPIALESNLSRFAAHASRGDRRAISH